MRRRRRLPTVRQAILNETLAQAYRALEFRVRTLVDVDLESLWKPYGIELERDFVSLSQLMRYVRGADASDESSVRARVLAPIEWALRHDKAEAGTHPEGSAGLNHVWRERVDETPGAIERTGSVR
jgi:hypothetical protein